MGAALHLLAQVEVAKAMKPVSESRRYYDGAIEFGTAKLKLQCCTTLSYVAWTAETDGERAYPL